MKKYMFLALFGLFIPFTSQATLVGFLDGQLFDQASGELKYICFLNGDCLDKDNNQTTRAALGLGPVPEVPNISQQVTQSTPQTVYTPVYIPTEQPTQSISQQPTQSVESVVPILPVLKPAYTELQLMSKFRDAYVEHPNMPGKPELSNYNYWWPISVNTYPTSVLFSYSGPYENYKNCRVVYNNVVVTSVANGTVNRELVTGLTPSTTYSYQVICTEAGREDSVFNKQFTTQYQE